mgnify:CR=1
MEDSNDFECLPREEADALVLEHRGWAESIARSVARAWNLDWELDGLDGAAMEALIFCARRFQPKRGVPFKGYARKRIHEASTEVARKCKSWHRGLGVSSPDEQRSREISADLLEIFPEVRVGELDDSNARSAIRQMLVGASLLAVKQGMEAAQPDEFLDYKRMIENVASLEPIHQLIIWKVYWEGVSLRSLAEEWHTDGLNVIREHKTVIEYLHKDMSLKKDFLNKPKVRPGLRAKAKEIRTGPFTELLLGREHR